MEDIEEALSYTPESLIRKRKIDGRDIGRLQLYASTAIAGGDTEVQQKEWYKAIERKYMATDSNETLREAYQNIQMWLIEGRALTFSSSNEAKVLTNTIYSFLTHGLGVMVLTSALKNNGTKKDLIDVVIDNLFPFPEEYKALKKDPSALYGHAATITEDIKYIKGYNSVIDILVKELDIPELEVFKENKGTIKDIACDIKAMRDSLRSPEKLVAFITQGEDRKTIEEKAAFVLYIRKHLLKVLDNISIEDEYPRKEQLEMALNWVKTRPIERWVYGLGYILLEDKGDPTKQRNY